MLMKNRLVAIEAGLEPFQQALERHGYRTTDLDGNLREVDAVVVRGTDNNLMNRQDILTKAPVVEAAGRTPENVLAELERRFTQQG